MKRLLIVLLALIQLPVLCIAHGQEPAKTATAHAKALSALGIIDEMDEKAFSVDEPITRADFVNIISGLVNYVGDDAGERASVYYRDVPEQTGIAEKVDYLTDLGFVSGVGDGLFAPEESVELVQVITVLAKILGYDAISAQYGGYPSGYIKSLREAGVKFTLENRNQLATGEKVTELVFQSLDATMHLTRVNGETYRDETVTILSKYHEIEFGEGVVTDAFYMDDVREGTLVIDDKSYTYLSRDVETWLGSMVKYFYDEEGTVLYLEPDKKNVIIDLDAVLIEGIENGRFHYYTDKSFYRSVSKRLGAAVDYYYNGVRLIPSRGEDLNQYLPVYEGSVRLVDNNDDGVLDYVSILNYDTFVVSDLITEDCVYYDKYTQRMDEQGGTIPQEPLDLNDEKIQFTHITDARTGVFLERSDITRGAVLSVAKSLDGTVYHIIVSDMSVTGTVASSGMDDRGRIVVTIEGKQYPVARAYTDFKGRIPNGTKATFKLTAGDVVVDFEVTSNYYYLIDVKEFNETGEDELIFQVFTPEGTHEKFFSAEKLTVNQHKNVTPEEAYEYLLNGREEIVSGIVIIEKNADGKLRKIYTQDADDSSEKKIYCRSGKRDHPNYDANLSVFTTQQGELVNQITKNIGGRIVFGDDTILFDVPLNPKTGAKNEFGVRAMSSFPHYTYLKNLDVYNSDENSLVTDVIVRQSTGQMDIKENQEAVVISAIYDMIDELGDEAVCVEGYLAGNPVTYIASDRSRLMAHHIDADFEKISDSEYKKTELGVGDIARFTFGLDGRINASEIMIDASRDGCKNMQATQDKPMNNLFNHSYRLHKAKIYRIDRGHIVITRETLVDTNDKPMLPATYDLMPTTSKTHCWIVDEDARKRVEEIPLLELKDYMRYGTGCDEVYIYQRECAYDIMIYR